MDILEQIEQKAKDASEKLEIIIQYIPGENLSDDSFSAKCTELNITCYGKSEEAALKNARQEVMTRLLTLPDVVEKLLNE